MKKFTFSFLLIAILSLIGGGKAYAEEIQVGTPYASQGMSYSTFVGYYSYSSETETIYKKALLEAAGLKSGDKIKAIQIKGYLKTTKAYTGKIDLWVGNAEENSSFINNSAEELKTDGMTHAVDQNLSWASGETYGISASNVAGFETIFDLQFSENFVYTGGDLHVIGKMAIDNTYCPTCYFEVEYNTDNTANGDTYIYRAPTSSSVNISTRGWTTGYKGLPVLHLVLAEEETPSNYTINGTVKLSSDQSPVAGIKVGLVNWKSEEVLKEGTTDENGEYSIELTSDEYNNPDMGDYDLKIISDDYSALESTPWSDLLWESNVATADFTVQTNKYSMFGTVTDGTNPIEGATVTLLIDDEAYEQTSTTDEYGNYGFSELTFLSGKSLSIKVEKDGYDEIIRPFTLTGLDTEVPEIVLSPANYIIKGSVALSSDQSPVAGIRVGLVDFYTSDVFKEVSTDENGEYSLELTNAEYGMMIDDYDLKVISDEYTSNTSYPWSDLEWNNKIATADFTVYQNEYTLFGIVTDGTNPIEGATVTLLIDDEAYEQTSTTDEYGNYGFSGLTGLSGKSLSLKVEKDGYMEKTVPVTLTGLEIEVSDIVLEEDPNTDSVSGMRASAFAAYGTHGSIYVSSPEAATVNIYSTTGILLRSIRVKAGTTQFEGFAPGIYIVNGKKVAIR